MHVAAIIWNDLICDKRIGTPSNMSIKQVFDGHIWGSIIVYYWSHSFIKCQSNQLFDNVLVWEQEKTTLNESYCWHAKLYLKIDDVSTVVNQLFEHSQYYKYGNLYHGSNQYNTKFFTQSNVSKLAFRKKWEW